MPGVNNLFREAVSTLFLRFRLGRITKSRWTIVSDEEREMKPDVHNNSPRKTIIDPETTTEGSRRIPDSKPFSGYGFSD